MDKGQERFPLEKFIVGRFVERSLEKNLDYIDFS